MEIKPLPICLKELLTGEKTKRKVGNFQMVPCFLGNSLGSGQSLVAWSSFVTEGNSQIPGCRALSEALPPAISWSMCSDPASFYVGDLEN